jgi:hypothetical protein
MDKTRAAIIASAGVGLLVSALVLHQWQRKRTFERDDEEELRAVVETDAEDRSEEEVR